MSRFTMENAEGYSQEQLDVLNSRYDHVRARLDSKPGATDRLKACLSDDKSVADHIAEHVQAQYDDGCAHESATTPDGHGAFCRFCGETLA